MQKRKSITQSGLALLMMLMLTLAACGSNVNISEDEVVKRATEELTLLQPLMNVSASKIKADLGNCAIIYENLSLNMHELPDFIITVDKLVVSGMDIPSYEGKPGDLTDIGSIAYNDIKIFMEGQQVGALDSYVLENVRLPYRDLVKTLRVSQELDAEDFALKIMPYLAGYEAATAKASNFTFNYMFVQAAIEKMEARDIKLGSYGPSSLSKFQVSAMGRKVFSLDKLGCEGMTFPQFLVDLMADPENYMDNNPEVVELLESDPLAALSPFEIKGFYIDNLYVDSGAPFSLKKFNGDFRLVDGAMNIKSGMQDLEITRALLAQSYELRPLAQAIDKDLLLSGDFNLDVTPKGELMDMVMQTGLKDNSLGGFSLDMGFLASKSAIFEDDYYYDYDADEYVEKEKVEQLKHMEMSLEDNGIIDLLVICYDATAYHPDGADGIYRQMFEGLDKAQAEAKNETDREAIAQLRKLLQDGGKLTFSLKPEQPVNFDDLQETMAVNPRSLGYKLDYTAPATPRQRR